MINYYKQTISLFFILISSSLFSQNEFITHWQAPVDSVIAIKTKSSSGPYNYTITYQSLTTPSFTGTFSGQTGDFVLPTTHAGDVIEVKISGLFPHFYMRYADPRNYLMEVTHWGTNQWKSMEWAFEGCEFLTLTATDTPDLSMVTSMEGMFSGCKRFNQSINNWNVSTITNMNDLFSSDSIFNQPLDTWNVTNVTTMNDMFSGTGKFNQPLSTWDVSNVTSMKLMFADAISFNQPLAAWSVSNVTSMYGMFKGTTIFNQPLNSWVVSGVTNMEQMFFDAPVFNQSLNSWNVSNVTRMNEMFKNAYAFNETVNNWNVSAVEYMYEMFSGAFAFNKPVNAWDVSNVTTMNKMFFGASSFDQPINNWDISNIVNMENMLTGATSLSYCHYDDALIAWKALPVVPTVITFGAVGVKYSAKSQSARSLLNTFHGWNITDSGITTGVNVNITASNNNFCIGNTSNLAVSSTTPGATFTWNAGLPVNNTHTVTPMVTTTYIATATDALGCTISDSIKVVVKQLPTITLQALQTTVCEKDTVYFTATGGDMYFWNEGLNPIANPKTVPMASTQYIVIGIDPNGCESSDTLFITVNARPNVSLQANDATICIGESAILTATGATTYTWNQGLTPGSTKTVTPSVTTKYVITGTDAQGCKNTDTLKVIVNELPVVVLQSNKSEICNGLSANLVASGASTYAWNQGLTAGSTKTVSPSTSTQYIVIGTDVNGCKSSDTIFITVNPCLGVEDVEVDFINIYPNPASETITLNGENLSLKFNTLYIIDMTGKTLYVAPISQSEVSISVADLTNGIYFVNLVGEQTKTLKIEVKH